MRFLFPSDPFDKRKPDETYIEEFEEASKRGFSIALFSFEDFSIDLFKPHPAPSSGDIFLYRGWMLSLEDYHRLSLGLEGRGATLLTAPEQYAKCHHLRSWYPELESYTPMTRFFTEEEDVAGAIRALGWEGCFLKDYVKSLSTDGGSLIRNLDDIPEVIEKMRKYRGLIEGGICARQLEDFVPHTEQRHFVYKGRPFSLSNAIPEVVKIAVDRISSPFFSVDTIETRCGRSRIVELGDGQVSDRKGWPTGAFLDIFC